MPGLATAEGEIYGFGEPESETPTFFKANSGRGLARDGFTGRRPVIDRGPAHEQAGGLDGQVRARKLDRIQSQPDVASIVPDIRSARRLDPARNRNSTRNQAVAGNHHGLVDHSIERGVGARMVGGDRILQPDREQRTGGQILRIVEWKAGPGIGVGVRRCAGNLSRRRIAGMRGGSGICLKGHLMLIGVS